LVGNGLKVFLIGSRPFKFRCGKDFWQKKAIKLGLPKLEGKELVLGYGICGYLIGRWQTRSNYRSYLEEFGPFNLPFFKRRGDQFLGSLEGLGTFTYFKFGQGFLKA